MSSDFRASVDLGGTKIAAAIALPDGRFVAEKTVPTLSERGPRAVTDRILALVRDLAAQAGGPLASVSVGVPGLADLAHGTVKFLPNLPSNWRDVPLREWLAPELGCPVYLLNDARMAALGELTYGRGQAANTMAFLTLGTGIGGAVVVDRKLRLGPLGAAGEIGHQTILPDGPRCGCGNRGCLEALASGPAIAGKGVWLMQSGRARHLAELVAGDAARVTPREMTRAAEAGDTAVREELVRAADYVGIGISNVIAILHPDLIVLGGSVAQIGPLLFDTIRQTVRQRIGMLPVDEIEIAESALGTRAGLLGGVALALSDGLVG